MKSLTGSFLLVIFFTFLQVKLYSQWEYEGIFPDPYNPDINQTGGIHGMAVDPDGKLWVINYYAYYRDMIYVAANQNTYVPVRAVYVFNPDGTQASFSPIKFLTINGITDTLGGYTTPYNTWEVRTGRGMRKAPDGNIVVAMYDTYYKINYLTGEGISKVTPANGVTVTAPAFSDNGNMFTAAVLPNNVVKEYNQNFQYLRDVIYSSVGFSRAFEVSGDGLTLYWAGYNNHCVYKYTRPDTTSAFINYNVILKGFDAESFAWHPGSGKLWVSAGSGNDLPNQHPDTLTSYSYGTWYEYDTASNIIQDSIKWQNLYDPFWQRPRAIAFNREGNTAYVGMFGEMYYEGIQKFISPDAVTLIRPNGGEFFSIGYTDTIKWKSRITNVKLEYSTNSGSSWNVIENSTPASPGKYVWTVPNTPSTDCLVKISDADDLNAFDVSENVFTISEPPVISVSPDSLAIVLNEGDSVQTTVNIANSGNGILQYNILLEPGSRQAPTVAEMQGQRHWDKSIPGTERQFFKSKNTEYSYKYNRTLPLIVSDPAGDGGIVDIIEIRGKSTAEEIQLQCVFHTLFNANDFAGILGFDTDQDKLTGIPLLHGNPAQEVGCEYYLSLFSINFGYVFLYDQNYNLVNSYPVQTSSKEITFSIPLQDMGNDNGGMNIAAVVGDNNGPTDWIPDQGYGVLGGFNWLEAEPLSGTVTPGNNSDINLKINTKDINGGEFYANIIIASNDPVNSSKIVPVHLSVIAQPILSVIDSVFFGKVFTGHYTAKSIKLTNAGSAVLQVSNIQSSNQLFSVQGPSSFSIPPESDYNIMVLFSPVNAGVETADLTITSNDLSSPKIIYLNGEGTLPPSISVSPASFYYELNVGDSVNTELVIDNSNGLGELTFEISDRIVSSKTSLKRRGFPAGYVNEPSGIEKMFGLDPEKLKGKIQLNEGIKIDKDAPENMMSLPVIVRDKIGDGGDVDIKEIRGKVIDGNVMIEYVLKDNQTFQEDVIASLYIDTDQNPLTGWVDPYYFHDIGVEYTIAYAPYYYGPNVYIFSDSGPFYSIPANINGNILSYSIPLAYLGYDDGLMDLVALSGTTSSPLDWAPDTGHATLGTADWLNENPLSGVIPAGGNLTIQLTAVTSDLIGGLYSAVIDISSNDPATPVVEVPFSMKLTGVPQISLQPDSLNFGKTYIGYSKSLYLNLTNTGTDSLNGAISSNDSRFVVMATSYTLAVGETKNIEVKFFPVEEGVATGHLIITSNAPAVPPVKVKGEGVIPPKIITSAALMEFSSANGDTINSSLKIFNTGGSVLNVQISDYVYDSTSSSERLFAAGNDMIYELNPANGQIKKSFLAPVYTGFYSCGLAFSGKELYFTSPDTSPNIFVLNPDNGSIIKTIPMTNFFLDGMAFIDPYLYVLDTYYNIIKVINPKNGTIVKTLNLPTYGYGGLDGGKGRLFVSSYMEVYELNPLTGAVKNSFSTNSEIYGIGFTGERLFTTNPWNGIEEYNPDTGNFIKILSNSGYPALAGGGKYDAQWLTVTPANFSVAAQDSGVVNLKLIPPQEAGKYLADIVITSNDPANPEKTVRVVYNIITGIDDDNTIPLVYSLKNNYPNPFNPSTLISYDLPAISRVTLKIYSITGEEIATLVNEEQNAGRYQVRWNASHLASGMYIYSLRAGDFVDVKKMILVK